MPLQADSPDSKFFQVKSGLYDALSLPEAEDVSFGFASFNQDALNARAKHWLYEAGSGGVNIPGFGPFPAAGSREVLGTVWNCDQGSGDDEAGCVPQTPADLTDAWELGRVRELAKGGSIFNQAVTIYVRQMPTLYKVLYTPVTGTLGSAVSLKVRVERCLNAGCTSRTLLGEPTVSYTPVSELLVWQVEASRTEPIGYFNQPTTAGVSASNSCSGWDPNTDTTADPFNGYSLRWPTVTTDPRGSLFYVGDVIPLDWQNDHRQDIQKRLAPNVIVDPLAAPDFRSAPYLRDLPLPGQSYLRLKNEVSRPLLAVGSTPLGSSLHSFRTWYAGWAGQAAAQDPLFYCRRQNLVLITDGEETCGVNPCAEAQVLYTQYGLRTWVVAYGADPVSSPTINCMAEDGGTGDPLFPRNRTELLQALEDVFVGASQP